MPITTYRNTARNITTFKCDGDLSFNEIVAVIERFFKGTVAPLTKKVLWDMRTASIDTLSADHAHHIANLVNGYTAEAKAIKIAVVVSKDIRFEIAKKFREKTEGDPQNIMVFRKIDEVTKWLEQESE